MTAFVLIQRDVDRLFDNYQISREIFRVYAPYSNVRDDDQIPTKHTIMVYEEQLKAGLFGPVLCRSPLVLQACSRPTTSE